MNKGNENKANFSKFPSFYIGGPFKSLPIAILVLTVLLYIFEAKKRCKKKV